MPGGDRTGPNGNGPMTGRRMGYCRDNDSITGTGQSYGFGRGGGWRNSSGFGRGGGFGFRRSVGFNAAQNAPEQYGMTNVEREIDVLKDRLSSLEKMRDDSESR